MISLNIYFFFAYFVTFFFGIFHDQTSFYNIPILDNNEKFYYYIIPIVYFIAIVFYKNVIYPRVNRTKFELKINKNILNLLIFIFLLVSLFGNALNYNNFRYSDTNIESDFIYYPYRLLSYFYFYLIYIIFFENVSNKNYFEIIYYLSPLFFLINGITNAVDMTIITTLILITKYKILFNNKINYKSIKKISFIIILIFPIILLLFSKGVKVKEKEVNISSMLMYTNATWIYERFYTHQVSLKNSLKDSNKYQFTNLKKAYLERKEYLLNKESMQINQRFNLNEHNNDIIYNYVLLRSGSSPGYIATFFYFFNKEIAIILFFLSLLILFTIFDKIQKNSNNKSIYLLSFSIIYLFGRSFLGAPVTSLVVFDESMISVILILYLATVRTKIV